MHKDRIVPFPHNARGQTELSKQALRSDSSASLLVHLLHTSSHQHRYGYIFDFAINANKIGICLRDTSELKNLFDRVDPHMKLGRGTTRSHRAKPWTNCSITPKGRKDHGGHKGVRRYEAYL